MSGPKYAHLGEVVRVLRQAAGLTRMQLGRGTKLGEHTVKAIEMRRHLPTRAQLDRLLAAPAMADLLALCDLEGVKVDLAPGDVGNVPGEDDGDEGVGGGPGSGGKP